MEASSLKTICIYRLNTIETLFDKKGLNSYLNVYILETFKVLSASLDQFPDRSTPETSQRISHLINRVFEISKTQNFLSTKGSLTILSKCSEIFMKCTGLQIKLNCPEIRSYIEEHDSIEETLVALTAREGAGIQEDLDNLALNIRCANPKKIVNKMALADLLDQVRLMLLNRQHIKNEDVRPILIELHHFNKACQSQGIDFKYPDSLLLYILDASHNETVWIDYIRNPSYKNLLIENINTLISSLLECQEIQVLLQKEENKEIKNEFLALLKKGYQIVKNFNTPYEIENGRANHFKAHGAAVAILNLHLLITKLPDFMIEELSELSRDVTITCIEETETKIEGEVPKKIMVEDKGIIPFAHLLAMCKFSTTLHAQVQGRYSSEFNFQLTLKQLHWSTLDALKDEIFYSKTTIPSMNEEVFNTSLQQILESQYLDVPVLTNKLMVNLVSAMCGLNPDQISHVIEQANIRNYHLMDFMTFVNKLGSSINQIFSIAFSAASMSATVGDRRSIGKWFACTSNNQLAMVGYRIASTFNMKEKANFLKIFEKIIYECMLDTVVNDLDFEYLSKILDPLKVILSFDCPYNFDDSTEEPESDFQIIAYSNSLTLNFFELPLKIKELEILKDLPIQILYLKKRWIPLISDGFSESDMPALKKIFPNTNIVL